MRVIFAAAFVSAFAIGCGQLTKTNKEYTFEMQNFLRESRPGCVPDTIPCASVNVTIPRFIGLDTSVQGAIDARIASMLSETLDQGSPKPIQGLADDFISDFEAFVGENPDLGLGWYYTARTKVLIATDTLISLQVDSDVFTGGAHGSYATRFINVDPTTGTAYLLDALLKPGYQELLTGLAYEDFKQQRGFEADSVGVESVDEGVPFELNDNYGFRKEGIVFFYNIYEIGAYAEGPTEIMIPYERLAGWFK